MLVRFFLLGALISGWVTAHVWCQGPSWAALPGAHSSSALSPPPPLDCNCVITQSGGSYPVSALQGNLSASAYYSYGAPVASSANTGHELSNGLVLFLYEDINTGIISLFLIADQPNGGAGGTMEFEISCLPPEAYVSVEDDAGEFFGTPPVITGDWFWLACCTDGGVIEEIGCGNTLVLDLLISSGLDSIVWLTGDIANPDQILLNMSGEAITITCGGGGGVCCPLGFDTESDVVHATCPDSPNGSIGLQPQDGTPNYTYDWSNGQSTQNISGLLPGLYLVTVTDAQGCSEELQFMVGVSPGDPSAIPADMEVCSENAEALFDLTTIEDIINLNSGLSVLWFENANLTGAISNPAGYLSTSTTIYAVVDNGSCLSDPVPVQLTVLPSPVGTPASMSLCEEQNDMATFDLTSLDNAVGAGAGNINWYEDPFLNTLISNPGSYVTATTTVYAVVDDGTCASEPVEITLTVDPKPEAYEAMMHLCGDQFNEAEFDLTLLENDISNGTGSVDWYQESDLSDPISNPAQFQTTTTTVYAVVYDGTCYSDPVEVDLFVDALPAANPLTIQACDEGSGQAWFELPEYDGQISGGAGGVGWYYDPELEEAIPNPAFFLTESTIVFAAVDDGVCVSDPVQIELIVLTVPEGNPAAAQTCPDSSGTGLFDLTALELSISGGTGTVIWFEDALGNFNITNPATFMTTGTIVYAQIEAGPCLSGFIPVTLTIVNSVQATPAQFGACDEGGGLAVFNLVSMQQQISGGSGQVLWFWDPAGTQPIISPDSFPSSNDTLFAQVSAGGCVSDIVDVELQITPLPPVSGLTATLCGDSMGQILLDLLSYDTLISHHQGTVSWYGDTALLQTITNPSSFLTGDTILYVTVDSGGCTSQAERVILTIKERLQATPLQKEFCIPAGEEQLLDLHQYEAEIHAGGLTVIWYLDTAGTLTLANPADFHLMSDTTLYVKVSDGLCFSETVPVQFIVLAQPTASGTTLKECGDSNGQAVFNLTGVETVISQGTGTVIWYTDAMLTNTIPSPGSILAGDTMIYAVVQNGFCFSPGVPVLLDVTDSLVATPVIIEICVQGAEAASIDLTQYDILISSGAGTVNWYADNQGLLGIADPDVYTTSGDTVFARIVSGACISNLAEIPIHVLGAFPPNPVCSLGSLDSLSIAWTSVTTDYEVSYTVHGQTMTGPWVVQHTEFGVGGLSPGDTVTFEVSALFDSICTNTLINTITCITTPCPQATLIIQDPGSFCEDDAVQMLDATISGAPGIPMMSWSGPGITDPSGRFDPSAAMIGENILTLTVMAGGCLYTAADTLTVHALPVSDFQITGTPCPDSILHVMFTGEASEQALFFWNFDGAYAEMTTLPDGYDIQWSQPGQYNIGLTIEDSGCFSQPMSLPVDIDIRPEPPVLICLDEDYHSVTVQWEPIEGAIDYGIMASEGTVQILGHTATVSQLEDDTDVSITIEALGVSSCGASAGTIVCRTRAYEPIHAYVPNAFSPNQDGINDVFFIQANPGVIRVSELRVYDRWGNLVFEQQNFSPNDPHYGWDGSFHAQFMNPGVYTYWAQLQTIRGPGITLAGDVTLVR